MNKGRAPTRYSTRLTELIEGRALRYQEKNRLSRDALATHLNTWDGILEWFPEFAAENARPPFTARLFDTWFSGDTSRGMASKTIPRPAALDAIAHFLIGKHYILPEELRDETDVGLALAFQDLIVTSELKGRASEWAGEFGFSVSGQRLTAEMRLRLTDEFGESCLTADVYTRSVGSHKKNRAYTKTSAGWGYPIQENAILLILHDRTPGQKDIWLLESEEDGLSYYWLSGHPLRDVERFEIPLEAIRSAKLKNLTPEDRSLYYRHRGLIPDKGRDKEEVGPKGLTHLINVANDDILNHLLIWCAKRDDVEGMAYALSRGADINFTDPKNGRTAFHDAVWYGNASAIEMLMADERLDPTILDGDGFLASRGALISLNEPELHVEIKELEDRWIEKQEAAKSATPPPPPPPAPM